MNKIIVSILASIIVCCICSCHKSDVARPATNNFIEDSALAFLDYEVMGTSAQVTISGQEPG
jgi:hypothetical protein